MRPMRLLAFASLVLCACGSDVAVKITCAGPSDQATCIRALADGGDMGKFLDFDASVAVLPQCCDNLCVVPATGCDSGFRYVTSLPGFGVRRRSDVPGDGPGPRRARRPQRARPQLTRLVVFGRHEQRLEDRLVAGDRGALQIEREPA